MTAAQSLGGAIQQQTQRGVFEKALLESGLDPVKAAAFAGIAGISPGTAQEVSKVAGEQLSRILSQKGTQSGGALQETQLGGYQRDPNYNPFAGRTPKEAVNLQDTLLKMNTPIMRELDQQSTSKQDQLDAYNQMSILNKTGKLPSGSNQFFNIDKDGNIRFPQAATPEAEAYNKLVANQIGNAKEIFGSRITNFDLSSFLKGLPTLSNTTEGRELILEMLQLNSQLDKLKTDSELEVYNAYGSQGITPDYAVKEAKKYRAPKEEAIRAKLNSVYSDFTKKLEIEELRSQTPKGEVLIRVTDKQGIPTLHRVDESKLEGTKKSPKYKLVEVL
jgi:hypothetical protein